MKPRNLARLAIALAVATLAPGLDRPALAEQPGRLDEILADPQAILNVIPALPLDLSRVDPAVVRVFLYNERKRGETDPLNGLIENRLSEELLALRRFKLIEAREAKTIRVERQGGAISISNTLDSLERLRAMGESLGADAAFMFAPQIQDRMVIVGAKLVRCKDGEILWTERFAYNFDLSRAEKDAKARQEENLRQETERQQRDAEKRTRDNGLYLYTGVNGFTTKRASTETGGASLESTSGLTLGLMGLRNWSFNPNAAFGLDVQFAQQGGVVGGTSLPSVTFSPLLFFRLDPIFTENRNEGFLNLYAGPGETLFFEKELAYSFSAKAGFLIRFQPEMFLDIGATYLPTRTVKFATSTGLASETAGWGGLTYHASVGLAFK
ncbi:MAG: hypothetical protein VKP72_08250 [bacterium]|nr:hypothetical protein [bacterium]